MPASTVPFIFSGIIITALLFVFGYLFPKLNRRDERIADKKWHEENPPVDWQDIGDSEKPYLSDEVRKYIYHNNQI